VIVGAGAVGSSVLVELSFDGGSGIAAASR
jgi:hypothetical protein